MGAEAWVALLTLTAMEIVLGIDNIVFISILANRLPEHERARARTIGLGLALFMRLPGGDEVDVIRIVQPVLEPAPNTGVSGGTQLGRKEVRQIKTEQLGVGESKGVGPGDLVWVNRGIQVPIGG